MARKINYDEWSKEELIKELRRIKETKYGLVWHRDLPEEKIDILINPDARTPNEMFPNEMAGKPFPILKETKGKEINGDKDKPVNLLIEGDNYHSLAVLNFTHQEAVDLIYIDPPYNTGSKDFIYNDKFVDLDDPFKHSKWLAFMEKRLKLARNLLKEDGLLFISIDDNEIAQLKLLCDEIFEEVNFRNSLVVSRVKKNIQEREFAKTINVGHGFILFYAKPAAVIVIPTKYQEKKERWHAFDAPGLRLTMEYKLFGHKPPAGRHWMFEEKKAKELIEKELLRPNPKTGKPQYKLEASDTTKLDTNWMDLQEGSSEWKFLNGEKNIELVKRIIRTHPSKNTVVLDFMAGSGTTGHAILQANKEDGGKRQFILCTNNEEVDNNGNTIKHRICSDICYPRLKKVIKGYQSIRGRKIEGLGGNLKYYVTDFVEAEPTDRNKRKLVSESTEMLCIRENAFELVQDESDFKIFKNDGKYLGIVFYEEVIGDFKKAIKKIKGHFNTYVFSLGDDPHEKQFADVKEKVTLCAIPEVILKVYREIFK